MKSIRSVEGRSAEWPDVVRPRVGTLRRLHKASLRRRAAVESAHDILLQRPRDLGVQSGWENAIAAVFWNRWTKNAENYDRPSTTSSEEQGRPRSDMTSFACHGSLPLLFDAVLKCAASRTRSIRRVDHRAKSSGRFRCTAFSHRFDSCAFIPLAKNPRRDRLFGARPPRAGPLGRCFHGV